MNRREYNGWTNYETWLVDMWYGDIFTDWQNDREDTSAQALEDFVTSMLEDQGQLPENGFVADIMNAALREIDWDELAEHYAVEDDENLEINLDGGLSAVNEGSNA